MIDDMRLIKEVEARPNLYHKNLGNRSQREADWVRVAEKVNLSSVVCKTRWRSIRDRYVKVIRQVNDDAELVSMKSWRLLPHLKFLKDHLGKARSKPPPDSFDHVQISMDDEDDDENDYFLPLVTTLPQLEHDPVADEEKFDPEFLDEFVLEEDTERDENDICGTKSQNEEFLESTHLNPRRHEHFLNVLAEKLDQLSEEECEDLKMDLLNQVHAVVKSHKTRKHKNHSLPAT